MNQFAITTLSTTDSSSTTDETASAVIRGGLSIAKTVNIGGTTNFTSIGTTQTATSMNSASLTLNATHYMIEVVFAGSAVITLPLAATCPGRQYFIIKLSTSGNSLTINASGANTIDGSFTTITSLVNPVDKVKLTSNGTTTWYTG